MCSVSDAGAFKYICQLVIGNTNHFVQPQQCVCFSHQSWWICTNKSAEVPTVSPTPHVLQLYIRDQVPRYSVGYRFCKDQVKTCLQQTLWRRDTWCPGTLLLGKDRFSMLNTLWSGGTCLTRTADRQIMKFSIRYHAWGDSLQAVSTHSILIFAHILIQHGT